MKKGLSLFIYIFIFVLLESAILNYFEVFATKPDLLLACVVTIGIFLPIKWVIILSCFAGFLRDIFSIYSFGLNTIIFCALGFLCKKISRNLDLENKFIIIVLVFCISFLYNIIQRFLNQVPILVFLKLSILGSLYTAFVYPIIFIFLKPTIDKYEDKIF